MLNELECGASGVRQASQARMVHSHQFFYAPGHHSTIRKFQRESSLKTTYAFGMEWLNYDLFFAKTASRWS